MAKLFKLSVLTPEREFFNGDAEAVTLTAPDGLLTILADHTPFIMPVIAGSLRIKKNGAWDESSNAEGFVEVNRQGVMVCVQACEHPEEIDMRRAEEALRRAEERLRQKRSIGEYNQSKLALARAMARLRITKSSINLKE